MLTFFRRIRKRFLGKGAASKYLLYAIGEIALVVIGILIALQINNWNDDQIKRTKEREILNDFRTELKLNLEQTQKYRLLHLRAVNSMNTILDHIKANLPYHDSLKYHFGNTTHIWEQELTAGVFETLKSIGLDFISNKELRDCLLVTYGKDNLTLKESPNRYHDMVAHASKYIFPSRFDQYWKGDRKDSDHILEMIPLDFEKLKKDQEYLYFLKSQRNQHGWYMANPHEQIENSMKNCIRMIEYELDFTQ